MRSTTLALVVAVTLAACARDDASLPVAPSSDDAVAAKGGQSPGALADGQTIFRFDTFGD
jgi:hypothetical protein